MKLLPIGQLEKLDFVLRRQQKSTSLMGRKDLKQLRKELIELEKTIKSSFF